MAPLRCGGSDTCLHQPRYPAEQILISGACGEELKDVTELAICNFFAEESKIVIVPGDIARATVLCQGGLPFQHATNNPFSDDAAFSPLDTVLFEAGGRKVTSAVTRDLVLSRFWPNSLYSRVTV